MAIFDINPRYLRSVRKALNAAAFVGPWEVMPVEPGSPDQQVWFQDDNDALRLRFGVRWDALKPVRKTA